MNNNIPVVIRNLKNNFHLIIQELGKLNLKTNVIPNRLEKYISFKINKKLVFVDSFQFFISSLASLVKDLGKDDLKFLGQELDTNVLDLVKRKGVLK